MDEFEKIREGVENRYRPLVLFIITLFLIEKTLGLRESIYSFIESVRIVLFNDFFILAATFIGFICVFILFAPIFSFVVEWGTYRIANIRYSLRIRSVVSYCRQFFSSLGWDSIGFAVAFMRIQTRKGFSTAIFGITAILYMFFLFAIFPVIVQIPERVVTSSVNIAGLWAIFFAIFGAGIPLTVFFIRHINENLLGVTLREYLKTHVLLTMVIVINGTFAFIFTIVGILSNDPVVTVVAGMFLIAAGISLVLLYISMIVVPLRGEFQGSRRNAAKSVIYLRALSESRSQIYNEIIRRYTDTETMTDDIPSSKEITAADLGCEPGDYLTDINLNKLRSTLDKYQIDYFNLSTSLGDKIRYRDTVIAVILPEPESDEKNTFCEFCSEMKSCLKSDIFSHKYGTPRESPENYLPFEGFIIDIEKECKKAIHENNRSKLSYRFQIYTTFLSFMVGVADQQDISKDSSSLPFNDIYNSMGRVLNEIESVKREIFDETTLEMRVALADLLYEHQEYIQNEFGESQHTKEINNILHRFQHSAHDTDSKHSKEKKEDEQQRRST